jgi:hypothetical protein
MPARPPPRPKLRAPDSRVLITSLNLTAPIPAGECPFIPARIPVFSGFIPSGKQGVRETRYNGARYGLCYTRGSYPRTLLLHPHRKEGIGQCTLIVPTVYVPGVPSPARLLPDSAPATEQILGIIRRYISPVLLKSPDMNHQDSPVQEYDIRKIIQKLSGDLISSLEQGNVQNYFNNLALLDSLIESLIKMIVILNLHKKGLSQDQMQKKWNAIHFGEAQNCAFTMGLIDETLFHRIETIQQERSSFIRLFWFYNYTIDENSMLEKIHDRLKVVVELSDIFWKMDPWDQDKEFFDIRSFTNLPDNQKEITVSCKLFNTKNQFQ